MSAVILEGDIAQLPPDADIKRVDDDVGEGPKSLEGRVSRRLRKKVEMLFAHLKCVLKLGRLRLHQR
jgi:hypothetical protein